DHVGDLSRREREVLAVVERLDRYVADVEQLYRARRGLILDDGALADGRQVETGADETERSVIERAVETNEPRRGLAARAVGANRAVHDDHAGHARALRVGLGARADD